MQFYDEGEDGNGDDDEEEIPMAIEADDQTPRPTNLLVHGSSDREITFLAHPTPRKNTFFNRSGTWSFPPQSLPNGSTGLFTILCKSTND